MKNVQQIGKDRQFDQCCVSPSIRSPRSLWKRAGSRAAPLEMLLRSRSAQPRSFHATGKLQAALTGACTGTTGQVCQWRRCHSIIQKMINTKTKRRRSKKSGLRKLRTGWNPVAGGVAGVWKHPCLNLNGIHSHTSPIVCGARIRCRFPPFLTHRGELMHAAGLLCGAVVLAAYTHHFWPHAGSKNTVSQLGRWISRPLSCLLRADKEAHRKCNEI